MRYGDYTEVSIYLAVQGQQVPAKDTLGYEAVCGSLLRP